MWEVGPAYLPVVWVTINITILFIFKKWNEAYNNISASMRLQTILHPLIFNSFKTLEIIERNTLLHKVHFCIKTKQDGWWRYLSIHGHELLTSGLRGMLHAQQS